MLILANDLHAKDAAKRIVHLSHIQNPTLFERWWSVYWTSIQFKNLIRFIKCVGKDVWNKSLSEVYMCYWIIFLIGQILYLIGVLLEKDQKYTP